MSHKHVRQLNRRGYFFVIDAIIAATILLLGIFVLLGASVEKPAGTQSITTADSFATLIGDTPLSSSTNSYYESTLLTKNLVPFADATPIEEIGYLVLSNNSSCPSCASYAENFSLSLIDEAIDSQYGVAIAFNGTVVALRDRPQRVFYIARPLLVYVRLNSTDVVGPVVAEVRLWQ